MYRPRPRVDSTIEQFCFICESVKPLSDFHRSSRTKSGYNTQCKDCRNNYNRRWNEINGSQNDAYKAKYRSSGRGKRKNAEWYRRFINEQDGARRTWLVKLARDFGLTEEQYNEMLSAQGGACAICRRTELADKRLAVDHCHKTGTVRGLLCKRCNSALGMLQEDPEIVRAALEYLSRHSSP